MASSINSITSGTNPAAEAAGLATNSSSTAATSGTDKLANTDTFLQLLVAQIKNQNPLDPTDSLQFVSQLAQFSQLEQVVGIRGDTQVLRQQAEKAAAAAQAPAQDVAKTSGQ